MGRSELQVLNHLTRGLNGSTMKGQVCITKSRRCGKRMQRHRICERVARSEKLFKPALFPRLEDWRPAKGKLPGIFILNNAMDICRLLGAVCLFLDAELFDVPFSKPPIKREPLILPFCNSQVGSRHVASTSHIAVSPQNIAPHCGSCMSLQPTMALSPLEAI